MDKPLGQLTFREHQNLSEHQELLIAKLQWAGVLRSSVKCSCDHSMSLQTCQELQDKLAWRCAKKHCKKRISIRTNSYFKKSKLSIGKAWVTLVCLLKFPKMLASYMSEILEVSEQALVDWGNYQRETISNYYLQNPLVLGGEHALQIDKSLFGGRRKYNRGNHQKHTKSWVFGIVKEDTKHCMLWSV
jgi:hypothetical protein